MLTLSKLTHFDNLSILMVALISFVSLSIASYSFRHLHGDRKQNAFYLHLAALITSVTVLVSADHILLFVPCWLASNFFLTRLMLHKYEWEAARQSALLALKNFALGFIALTGAFLTLYIQTGETSIQAILKAPMDSSWSVLSGLLILLAAIIQSALWPFHRWLISSLNSPTPVCAIMHAGLVNGGGFLVARFAPLYFEQPNIMSLIFIIGTVSAILGTLWKLMQTDIKRMLACSTMGQMGFMFAQCGLGLFPAAIVHLCCHGLFKAYLFLASGSAAKEKRLDLEYPPSLKHFILAGFCGLIGAYLFSIAAEKTIFTTDTSLFPILLIAIAGTQLALPIVRGDSIFKIPFSLLITSLTGGLYGISIDYMEQILAPLGIYNPQSIHLVHIVGFSALFVGWLMMVFSRPIKGRHFHDWILKCYVWMLNASQPLAKTTTPYRNHYEF